MNVSVRDDYEGMGRVTQVGLYIFGMARTVPPGLWREYVA